MWAIESHDSTLLFMLMLAKLPRLAAAGLMHVVKHVWPRNGTHFPGEGLTGQQPAVRDKQ